jgi:hypothetical protein
MQRVAVVDFAKRMAKKAKKDTMLHVHS